ncbi:MAG TPA: Mur ligase family protein, partial [Segetibacter sp.]
MAYTIKEISSVVGGTALLAAPEVTIENLLIDSRRLILPSATLFFALKTERKEGSAYVGELYEKGVKSFVVNTACDTTDYAGANFIKVDNTLSALQMLAAFHRSQFNIPVVGITGSNGKTIVKEWLYHLLQNDYNIVRSPKSYNSQIGVPLSVWQMNEEH